MKNIIKMKSILTFPTAFVLFVLFSFTFSSCKKCSKNEPGNTNNTPSDTKIVSSLVPLTPAQLEAKAKQNKAEAVRDKIAKKLQEAQVEVKKMIENRATKASAAEAHDKVKELGEEADKLFDDEIEVEKLNSDMIKKKLADGDTVVLNAIEAHQAAYTEAIIHR
jgi:molecular chaperone DnaK (HSP70)